MLALPVLAFGAGGAVRVPEALQLGQVHSFRHAGVVRRVQLSKAVRAGAGGRVADGLADGVGSALVKADARVEASAVDAGRVLGAVVVEMASVFALPVLADLAERAVGVSPAARKANPVSSAVLRLLAELSGQAVSVVEADLDAGAIDAPLAQGTLDVDVAAGKTILPDTDGALGANVRSLGALDRSSDASVSGIRKSVARYSAESDRALANGVDSVGRLAHGVGAARVGEGARVVAEFGVDVDRRQRRHEEGFRRRLFAVDLRRSLKRRCRRFHRRAETSLGC